MIKFVVVTAIRPDFIRTSKILKLLKQRDDVDLKLIHTGQHYDSNLSDVFFKEMDIPVPHYLLNTTGKNHNEQHSKLILQLSNVLESEKPDACIFLGDANAVIGCIAPLKLGIPIIHIEAGMRSFDWTMPEERNRVIIDRVSDLLYVYHEGHKINLVREGVCPTKIKVVGNVIVDIVNYGLSKIGERTIKEKYALMTLHRNEHVTSKYRAASIIRQVGDATSKLGVPVILIEMPRLKKLNIKYPKHFVVRGPLGFFEFLNLEKNALIEYTDSGTNQEVASILKVPCVVTRETTERPETFECGTTFMSGYSDGRIAMATEYALSSVYNDEFSIGDGYSSERIVYDIVKKMKHGILPFDNGVDKFKIEHFKTVGW